MDIIGRSHMLGVKELTTLCYLLNKKQMKSRPGLKTHLILSYSLTPEIFGSSMIA